jgi:hypothetical protein
MKIPQASIGDFAKEYFALFTAKGGTLIFCLLATLIAVSINLD